MSVTGNSASPSSFAGEESPGTDVSIKVGAYSVDEGTHDGYTKSLSTDCTGTIMLGETKTCTITNDDDAPGLHLRKVVVNDNGGTATVANFTLTANGTGTNDLSGTSPVDSGPGLNADTFALSESTVAGYTASSWVCVGGTQSGSNITVGLGESATCTITNNDIAPQLHLRKVVVNNNGGTKTVADFTLTANGTGTNDLSGTSPVDSGPGLQADTWALSESNVTGYSASSWYCTGGTQSGCEHHRRHRRLGDLHDHQQRHRASAAPAQGRCEQQRWHQDRRRLPADRRRSRHERPVGDEPG